MIGVAKPERRRKKKRKNTRKEKGELGRVDSGRGFISRPATSVPLSLQLHMHALSDSVDRLEHWAQSRLIGWASLRVAGKGGVFRAVWQFQGKSGILGLFTQIESRRAADVHGIRIDGWTDPRGFHISFVTWRGRPSFSASIFFPPEAGQKMKYSMRMLAMSNGCSWPEHFFAFRFVAWDGRGSWVSCARFSEETGRRRGNPAFAHSGFVSADRNDMAGCLLLSSESFRGERRCRIDDYVDGFPSAYGTVSKACAPFPRQVDGPIRERPGDRHRWRHDNWKIMSSVHCVVYYCRTFFFLVPCMSAVPHRVLPEIG